MKRLILILLVLALFVAFPTCAITAMGLQQTAMTAPTETIAATRDGPPIATSLLPVDRTIVVSSAAIRGAPEYSPTQYGALMTTMIESTIRAQTRGTPSIMAAFAQITGTTTKTNIQSRGTPATTISGESAILTTTRETTTLKTAATFTRPEPQTQAMTTATEKHATYVMLC